MNNQVGNQAGAGFTFYDTHELVAANFIKRTYLDRERFIVHPGRTLVWGAPGSFKTWFTLTKIVEVAARGYRVVACIGEGDQDAVRERLLGIAKAQNHYLEDFDSQIVCMFDTLWMEGLLGAKFFEYTLATYRPNVVLIDPLISYYGGDENDVKDVKKLLKVLNESLVQRGVSVILVHHSRKSQKDAAEAPRGSGAFTGWADIEIQCEAVKKTPGVFKVEITKVRDDRKSTEPDYYRWALVDSIEGYSVTKIPEDEVPGLFNKAGAPARKGSKGDDDDSRSVEENASERQTRALAFLKESGANGATKNQIRTAVKCSGATAQRLLDTLFASGVAVPTQTELGTVWRLTEDRTTAVGPKPISIAGCTVPDGQTPGQGADRCPSASL